MKNIKNFLPVEFYFLLLPAIFLFILSFLYLKSLMINAFSVAEFLKNSLDIKSHIFLISPFFIFISILFLLLFLSIIFDIASDIVFVFFLSRTAKKDAPNSKTKTNWKHIVSIFLIILFILFVTYSLTLFTNLLFKIASPTRTAQFGKVALSWDKAIFKTDPGVWMINHFGGTFFESVLLWVYNSIFAILAIVLLASFFFNKKSFRRLILSFFIAWIIALPLWFLFPTLPPDFMFRLNDLNMAGAKENKIFNSFNPSLQLKENLKVEEDTHIINKNPSERLLPTSTFPSMHAAWGVIIAYAGITLSPWFGIFLVPWALLNGVGAVYILEHFSVDIFFGFFIAFVAIIITEMLLHFESKYFEDKFGLLSGFDYVKLVAKNFLSIFKRLINLFLGINKKTNE